jgi:hypothetical protein
MAKWQRDFDMSRNTDRAFDRQSEKLFRQDD